MSETTLAAPDIQLPPTQLELPYDDGVPMESARHKAQMDLLIDALIPWLEQREDGFVGGNMFVYYSLAQVRNKDFKGPDFFIVLGVPKGERRSWVVWEEGKAPDVVIELLSPSTASTDKNEKMLIYQNQMRVSEYFWYDPFNSDDLAGFSLQKGVYLSINPNNQNQLVSQSLQLGLQLWQGNYKGIEATWLRWANLAGELLPTPEEKERQRADNAQSQLRQTARNLLETGMTLEQVVKLTGLSASEIEQE
ncbi:Uma2 family endonuclease [Nostoc sp. CMAA1605]|uniref:Uma2 family endonuclease n=1 Tax=Nostoc sp. CMAA1605 TaxID=2055159 RepID=UPI001F22151D|nr:Uma2 family endonuclease [Nostoc sp. CMAA1605]MCF4970732.1 hypothetical protein [Nostoc sp. CMAA1605]